MLERFVKYIREEELIRQDDKILLGISGGIDSMVMAELFEMAGYNYAIAHCNFGLRGIESEDDEAFVRKFADDKNKTFHFRKFDTKNVAANHGISIQMAARQLRIGLFEELIAKFNYTCYATAHHLDDQIETLFVNLLRGTGIAGFHGIQPKHGNLIHPMLFLMRREIRNFASKHNITYREDSSNKKKDYLRNKIRHDLLPVIEAINPDYRPTFTSTIFRLKQAEQIYRKQIKSEENNLIEKDKDTTRINIEKLSHLNPIETYLFELIEPFGFKFPAVYDIIHSITTEPGKKFHSPTHRMIRDREYFIIKPIEKNPQNHQIYLIEREDKEVMEPVKLKIQQFAKPANFTPPVEPGIAALDYDQIKFPLRIRKWQNGDTFYPIGMQQKKLLSDFFIDNKFSLDEKEKTWLLVSGSQIAWIIGHRIDDRFKITHTTKVIQQFNLF